MFNIVFHDISCRYICTDVEFSHSDILAYLSVQLLPSWKCKWTMRTANEMNKKCKLMVPSVYSKAPEEISEFQAQMKLHSLFFESRRSEFNERSFHTYIYLNDYAFCYLFCSIWAYEFCQQFDLSLIYGPNIAFELESNFDSEPPPNHQLNSHYLHLSSSQ